MLLQVHECECLDIPEDELYPAVILRSSARNTVCVCVQDAGGWKFSSNTRRAGPRGPVATPYSQVAAPCHDVTCVNRCYKCVNRRYMANRPVPTLPPVNFLTSGVGEFGELYQIYQTPFHIHKLWKGLLDM